MRRLILIGALFVFGACSSEESVSNDVNTSIGGTSPATGGSGQGTGGGGATGGEGGGGQSGNSSSEGCVVDENCRLGCESFGAELAALLGELNEVAPEDPPEVVELSCEYSVAILSSYCRCIVESDGICWRMPALPGQEKREQWKVACPGGGGMGGGGASRAP